MSSEPQEQAPAPAVRLAIGPIAGRTKTDKALGPDVRLAVVTATGALSPENLSQALAPPSVRLAIVASTERFQNAQPEEFKRAVAEQEADAPNIRLAHVPGAQGDNTLLGQKGVAQLPSESRPALLVSYVYLEPFLASRHRYAYRDWVMDSGAFSAHQSGTKIDIDAYIEKCRELLATDPTLTEVFGLDVIGDHIATAKNTDKMWAAGVPAIPCYHVGEPEAELIRLAKNYPKIALGGAVGFRGKEEWAGQCFARVWPCKIHGFGFGSNSSILSLPWHSVDATNWEIGPCKFGRWRTYKDMSVRGSKQNLRVEVESYLKVEREARQKWRREMQKLEELYPTPPRLLPPGTPPSVRLAIAPLGPDAPTVQRAEKAFNPPEKGPIA
jgi:hypothetical protein